MTVLKGRAVSYLRLSKDDVSKGKYKKFEASNSIVNQRAIVERTVNKYPDLMFVGEYCDDGFSGMDFNRKDFIRLEKDAAAGKFDMVLVKDISRFGREQTGVTIAINRFISKYRVNVISITEDYNCAEDLDGLEMKIKILLNEFYSQNISEKVRAEVRSKQELGKFIGAFSSYGYKKDPTDRNHLIIDKEAAAVVKRVFGEFLNGKGKLTIARDLNRDGIPCPSLYKELNGFNYKNANKLDSTRQWTYSTVNKVLHNRIYTGAMVQGKSKLSKFDRECKVFDDNDNIRIKTKQIEEDKWFVVENTHEPIISKDEFEITRGLLKRSSRTINFENISLFAGMIKCGDCGKALVKNKSGDRIYYICSKYRQLGKDACTRHTVGEDMLSKYILKELYNDAKLYRDGLNTLKQREEEYKKRISENDLSLEISNYRKSADKLQEQKRVWIRNAVNGVITEEEADAEVRRLSEEQERINKAISALEKKNGKPDGLKISENSLIEGLINEDLSVLTRKILQTYIKSITVFEKEKKLQIKIEKTYISPEKII